MVHLLKRNFIWRAFPISVYAFLLLTSCGGDQNQSQANGVPETVNGATVFRKYCVTCHGSDGKLGLSGAKNLTISTLSLEDRIALISNGKGLMASYKDRLSDAEIQAVAEYTLQLKK